MKNCLFCAEEIQDQAIICRYCSGNQAAVLTRALTPVTSWKAILSLVASALWVFWIGSVIGIVYGYLAQKEIDETGGAIGGRGMATWGIVLGWCGLAFAGLALLGLAYTYAGGVFYKISQG